MRLGVSTPLAIVIDVDHVTHLRAEDETGAFGILPGHADFLTALAVSVVAWRNGQGVEHYVAVRGGMLQVRDGEAIVIATREAIFGDDLHHLETAVLADFRRRQEEDRAARTDAQRLYLAAIRQICYVLRPKSARVLPGAIGRFDQSDL